MPRYVEVKDGQSIDDLAVQYYGSSEGVLALLQDNPDKLDLMNTPETGALILIYDEKVIDKDVVNKLIERGASPANSVEIEHTAFTSGFSFGFK